jgi:hypothetical protein
MFSFLYHCRDFYRTWLYIWVTRRVSYEKQELPTLRKHLSSSPGFFVGSVLLIFLVFCVVLLCVLTFLFVGVLMFYLRYLCVFVHCGVQHKLCFVFLRLLYPMLAVSLDFPFLISPSVFSNVYFTYCSEPNTPLNWFPSTHLGYLFLISPKTDNMFWKQWKLKDHKIVDPCML